jgi:hypothetical protein
MTSRELLALVLAGEVDEDVLVTGYDPSEIQPGIYGEAEGAEDWWGAYDG